jgi:hypothetical protein
MWVGILDERIGFVRTGASPVHAAVSCDRRGTTASERALCSNSSRRRGAMVGSSLREGRHQDKTKALTMETLSLSLSLFSRKTTELN